MMNVDGRINQHPPGRNSEFPRQSTTLLPALIVLAALLVTATADAEADGARDAGVAGAFPTPATSGTSHWTPLPPPGEPLRPGAAADPLAFRTYEVVASAGRAWAATTAGLTIHDISDPAAPRIIESLHFPGSGNGIAVHGTRAFLALGPAGLRVVDISDPSVPVLTAALDTDGSVNAVAVVDRGADRDALIVIADGAGGIKSIAVTAEGPRVVGSMDTGRYAVHVDVQGEIVAAAEEDDGVGFYRLRADGSVSELAVVRTPGTARGVALRGSRCFVAAGMAGAVVIDLRDEAAPRVVATIPTSHYARGIAVKENLIFVADSQAGLRVMVEAERDDPEGRGTENLPAYRLLASFETGGSANRVALSGGLALVAIDAGGIKLIDVPEPGRPGSF